MNQQEQQDWLDYFTSHFFTFGREGATPYTRTMYLTEKGEVGGYGSANEVLWDVKGGQLTFYTQDRTPTTHFALPQQPSELVNAELIGQYLFNDEVKHVLHARPMTKTLPMVMDRLTDRTDKLLNPVANNIDQIVRGKKIRTKHPIRIAFLLNSVETLPALSSLINATLKDQRFEIKLIVSDKVFQVITPLHTIEPLCQFLDAHHYDYIRVDQDFPDAVKRLRLWQADFIVRQSEWDTDWPSAFSGKNLCWARLIYIPYVITESFVQSPDRNSSLLTNDYYQYIWRYYLPAPLTDAQHREITRSYISLDTFKSVGSIKANQIKNAKPYWPLKGNGKRVIWMAHHTIFHSWFNFGTFIQSYPKMLKWAQNHPELQILFNPHPLLRINMQLGDEQGKTYEEEFKQFLAAWDALPNTGVWEKKPQYQVTQAADVILTDGISSLYEMQIQNKPIVGIIRPDHIAYGPDGEKLMTGVHVTHTTEEAQAEVLDLLNHANDLVNQEQQNVAPWLANAEPEQAIIDDMVQEMK